MFFAAELTIATHSSVSTVVLTPQPYHIHFEAGLFNLGDQGHTEDTHTFRAALCRSSSALYLSSLFSLEQRRNDSFDHFS